MIKKVLFTLFGAFILSAAIHLQAQDAQVITLNDAIEIALENNFQLKQAQNNLSLAEERIKSEYADFLPSLSTNVSGRRSVGRGFSQEQGRIINEPSTSLNGSLSANITIFDGFNNINSLRLSKQQQISREEALQRAKENIIFNTAQFYLQVLLDRELLEIARENLATSENQLEQVTAQVEVGSRASVDLYEQEALVASNELTVTQRENNLRFNELQLVRHLQIDPLGNYEFITPDFDKEENVAQIKEYNLSELIDEALFSRSDLKSAMANLRGLDYQVKIAEGNLYPSVSGNASVSSDYTDGLPGNFNDQFLDLNIRRSFGISLNIPIFQNWNRMYNIQQAKVQLKNAELDLEDTRLQVIQEVAQAYNDYTSYVKQLEASEKALIASERAFETQQERFNVGSSTFVELSQAQANYVQAQSDYSSALYNIIFQEKLLEYYLGKLNGDTIEF